VIGTAQSEKSASGYRAYFKRRAFSRFGVPGADTNHERAEGDNFLVAIPQRNYKHASVTKAACMVTQRRQRATDLCLNLEHNSSVVVGRLAGQKTMAIGPTTQATLTSARALREEQTTTPFEPKPTIPQPQHAPGGLSCYRVVERLPKAFLQLERQSGPQNSPHTIAMEEKEFLRANHGGLVPINWEKAQLLPDQNRASAEDAEQSESED
jgi:hypothetical protein